MKNLNRKRKVFNDVIADMLRNKQLQQIYTELIVRSRKRSISLVFVIQTFLAVPKNIGLNST